MHESIREAVTELLAGSSEDDDFDSYLEVMGQTFDDPGLVLFAVSEDLPLGEVYLVYRVGE